MLFVTLYDSERNTGETYTIWIKDIQSTSGQTAKYTKKTFTVK